MGTCWNCDTELSLQEGQTECDNCGEIVYYKCNNCKEEFKVEDKESKKKLKVCKLCGYFFCPHCGTCYWNCRRYEWERVILKILVPEVTQANCPNLLDKVKRIISHLEQEKIGIERKDCPERNVPITYAKSKIKSLLAKVEGFRVKNEKDREAFIHRMNELEMIKVGEIKTVSQVREEGSYGQEYRDAFNLLVCLGKFKIEKRTNKEDEEYDVFVRCDLPSCKFLAKDSLIINYCEHCKTTYPRGVEFCSKCSPYKKGKHIGELPKLKERLSNKDTCQCYRGHFKNEGLD